MPGTRGGALRAWAELLRVSALFTVPGDALAGAAAVGLRPNRGTALAVGASLCLYEAGMALNDWSDRGEDAVDRPHRPIPSGRITPGAALAASAALTAAGLALAARAGRPALAVATALSATVWSYDLHLKHTEAGPVAMATARGLDLLLGATATVSGPARRAPLRPVPPGGANAVGRSPVPGPAPDSPPRPPTAAGARAAHAQGLRAAPAAAPDTTPDVPSGAVQAPGRRPVPGAGSDTPLPSDAPGGGSASGASRLRQSTPSSVRSSRRAGAGRSGGPGAPGPHAHVHGLPGALPAAALLAAHTYAVTAVSRHEAQGGSTLTPLGALAAAVAIAAVAARPRRDSRASARSADQHPARPGARNGGTGLTPAAGEATTHLLTAVYLHNTAKPLLHAALNPSPPLTQRAVGGGIRAMIPLQAALAARAGAKGTGLAVMGLAPLARRLARRVSPT
ncbi:UbiA family prenyltransferase [Streptomyces sp. NPDC002889]|uniref:UbiA family prenyltransferase n=1 Tax=Streptomyces sp. NPDC002889 TaxID=3364669 RepID=UPI0036B254CF